MNSFSFSLQTSSHITTYRFFIDVIILNQSWLKYVTYWIHVVCHSWPTVPIYFHKRWETIKHAYFNCFLLSNFFIYKCFLVPMMHFGINRYRMICGHLSDAISNMLLLSYAVLIWHLLSSLFFLGTKKASCLWKTWWS